jgi:predicted acylesterase/phospholipase RssA
MPRSIATTRHRRGPETLHRAAPPPWHRSAAAARLASALLALVLAACSGTGLQREAVPAERADTAQPIGFDRVRVWGDERPPFTDQLKRQQITALKAKYRAAGQPEAGVSLDVLALSGGAEDGAFGAGLLTGWSDHGTRPQFQVVTGISAGALIAPFAYLGPDYDQKLREAFTDKRAQSFATPQVFAFLFGALSFLDVEPLRAAIRRYVSPELVQAVAREHRTGRRLLIGTTNLDAGRLVIWNMGRIANSESPRRIELFRKVILASASIPGAYPPVRIAVKADGRYYTELHVDGGVAQSVFAYPFQLRVEVAQDLRFPVDRRLYVIQNNCIDPPYRPVEGGIGAIAESAFSTLIRHQSGGDLFRIFAASQRDQIAFRLATLPDDFDMKPDGRFDPAYMTHLFERAHTMAEAGYPWRETPPGLTLQDLK